MDTSSLVQSARAGDLEAFGLLVARFQDLAYAVAYTVVGDAHLAQDAAQEAFIEAYVCLPKLREPAAFPGWFRRIVHKRADRLIRSKSPSMMPLDLAGGLAAPAPGPAALAEARELQARVHGAIAGLCAADRQVVVLFYITGYSQPEIAAVLDLPLSTVKKRLFDARKRLRAQLDDLVREHVQERRPSHDPRFVRLVQFFIAVRLGDLPKVAAFLDADPQLAAAQERWDEATARQFGLPVIVGLFTALHRAVYNGDAALAALLIERGADPNARAGYDQTPLQIAVQANHVALVGLLLAAGANPNDASSAGISPLHSAVILGRAGLATQLLAAGADPHAADRHGRTPIDWAKLKAQPELIELFDRLVSPAQSAPAQERQLS